VKLFLSNSLPREFTDLVASVCGQLHVPLTHFSTVCVAQSEDIILADAADDWLNIKTKGLLLVALEFSAQFLNSKPTGCVPLFLPREHLQDKKLRQNWVSLIETLLEKQWVTHSNLQEVHARIKELIDDLQEQLRAVRILFRNALRKSFPNHEFIEASLQQMEPTQDKPIHYFDYFGHPKSQILWVLGATVNSYSQSADLIDLIQSIRPEPEVMSFDEFIKIWKQKSALIAPKNHPLRWTWLCFNFKDLQLYICSVSTKIGVLWKYSEEGLQSLSFDRSGNAMTIHALKPREVMYYIQGLEMKDSMHLQEIERRYESKAFTSKTALSHLHDQLLQYSHDQEVFQNGGASFLMRLRPKVFQILDSQGNS
jgi:hypothetical protein